MIAENWAIMRKRLEMRFLPILGFAEMKPQALRSIIFAKLRVSTEVETSIFSEQIVILQRVKY